MAKKREWALKPTVFSALRRAWRNCPARREVLAKSKKEYYVKCKNGNSKRRVHFKCAVCGQYFDGKDINVDHIEPVIDPNTGFTTYDNYIERLFCPIENLQVICRADHELKSSKEVKVRAKVRRVQKKDAKKEPGKTKAPKVAKTTKPRHTKRTTKEN